MNAPKSVTFLTMPLRTWPTSSSLTSCSRLRLALLLEDDAAAHHDVAAALVQLDDLEVEGLTDQVFDVRNATQCDLRAGQERVDAHQVHRHAALDLAGEHAGHLVVLFIAPVLIFSQTRRKSAFFFDRTTTPSASSRFSRKTSTSSPGCRDSGS